MDNNQFNQTSMPSISTKKIFEYVGLGCSALGCLLTFIFSIVTCSRGGAVYWDKHKFKMSLWLIGVIISALIAIAGLVFTILSLEKGQKLSKLAMVSIILAAVAIVYAIIPNATICSYNCMLNDKLGL